MARPVRWEWESLRSADRNIKAKINWDGIWLEDLEREPGRHIPEEHRGKVTSNVVKVDLNRPMKEILAQLTKYPVTTQLSLNGTMIVARDIAHAKLKERLDKGERLPQYLKDHPIYYAGPAKTPKGMPSGFLRSHHRRAHGFICRSVSVARRLDDHVGKGQSERAGDRSM